MRFYNFVTCKLTVRLPPLGLGMYYEERYCKLRTRNITLSALCYLPFIYAAETWTKKKKDERRLSIFERKILCRIFGPIYQGGQWQKR